MSAYFLLERPQITSILTAQYLHPSGVPWRHRPPPIKPGSERKKASLQEQSETTPSELKASEAEIDPGEPHLRSLPKYQ